MSWLGSEFIEVEAPISRESSLALLDESEDALEGEIVDLDDEIGFLPFIGAAIAGIASAVSGGAAAVASVTAAAAPLISAVGGAAGLAKTIEGGINGAKAIINAAKSGDAKAIAKLRSAKAKQASRERARRAEDALVETMLRARQGDVKAQSVVAGLETLMDPNVSKALTVGAFASQFGTLPKKALLSGANKVEDGMVDLIRRAKERAKKDPRWAKKPAPNKFPVSAMKKGALAGAKKAIKKTVAARKKKGAPGILVLPNGRIARGSWLPA